MCARQKTDFVLLCHPGNPAELAMLRGLLTTEGVRFYIHNEHVGGLTSPMGTGIAPIGVMVAQDDLERAKALLAQIGCE
jgi:hypothetical protein